LGQGSTFDLGKNPSQMGDYLNPIQLGTGVEISTCLALDSNPTITPTMYPTFDPTIFQNPVFVPTFDPTTTYSPTSAPTFGININNQIRVGNASNDFVRDSLLDSKENLVVVGHTKSSLFKEVVGNKDVFAAKYDNQLNFIWGFQEGALADDAFYSACVDKEDNIYAAGFTNGGLFTPSNGGLDIIAAKINSTTGNNIWGIQNGTSKDDVVQEIACGNTGYVVVGGYTSGDLIGSNKGTNTPDYFLAKLDSSNGKVIWGLQVKSQFF